MKLLKKTYSFDKSEIFIIFLLLIFCGILIFSVGIMIGKKMLENECKIMLEDLSNELDTCKTVEKSDTTKTENNTENINETEITEKTVELEKKEIIKVDKKNKLLENNENVFNDNNINKQNIGADLEIKEITNDIKNKFTVQIGAFQDELEAIKKTSKLYKDGYKSAYYMQAVLPKKGLWYRVGIGFFPKKNSAQLFAQMLKRQGKIDSFIIRKVR